MAMPTIIASWGGGTSNAYVDLAYANLYMDTKVSRDYWDSAGDDKRTAALIEATRQIDATNWGSSKYYYAQRLEFPRTALAERAGISELTAVSTPDVEAALMESRVKEACCEQALYIIEMSGDDPLLSLQRRGVTSYSESIGKISESYSFGRTGSALCPEAMRLLGYYRTGRRIVRG